MHALDWRGAERGGDGRTRHPLGECSCDRLTVARVRDHEIPLGAEAVDDDVVDDAAIVSQQERVLRAADRQRREFAPKGVVKQLARARSRDEKFGHVRDVEDAGGFAHGAVLGEVRRIANRHLPATKIGEGGA